MGYQIRETCISYEVDKENIDIRRAKLFERVLDRYMHRLHTISDILRLLFDVVPGSHVHRGILKKSKPTVPSTLPVPEEPSTHFSCDDHLVSNAIHSPINSSELSSW